MKIKAIRLREVGIFREPIAVEGFSGALDILAGPNELGKSTILRAMRRVFLAKHTANGQDIERLRPHGGGAPLIEVDFEADGRTWRLRKQFLSGKAAELRDMSDGHIAERGADAHARALELIGSVDGGDGAGSPLGLLWVDQSDGMRPLAVGADERSLLLSAIGAEVSEVATGHAVRTIEGRVAIELDALLTHKTRRPKGDYDASLKAEKRLTAELDKARAIATHTEHKREELERLRAERAILTDPARTSALQDELAAAHRRVEEARSAREKWQLAHSTSREREATRRRIADALAALTGRLRERRDLEARLTSLGPEMETARAADANAVIERDAAASRRAGADAALREARELLTRVDRRDALLQLRTRHGEACRLAGEQARLRALIDGNTVTDGLLRKAEAEQGSIDRLRAEIEAGAPRVTIAYANGVRDAIRVAGRPLADGAMLRPTVPLVLDIPGVGQITIEPVAAFDLAEAEADLRAHEEELASTLARMGVRDLAAARGAIVDKQKAQAELAVVAEALVRAAPDGPAALEQRLAAAERASAPADAACAGLPLRTDVVARIADLDAQALAANQAFETANDATSRQAQSSARLGVLAQATRERLAVFDAEMAEAADPATRLGQLEMELAEASAAGNAALREVAAWAEVAPDDRNWQHLQSEAARLEAVHSTASVRLAAIEQSIARCEGELTSAADGDVLLRCEELTGELDAVRTRIGRFVKEVAALDLLRKALGDAQALARDAFLAPVLKRVEPYLAEVLPEARLALGDGFEPAALTRGQTTEVLASLSGGTQEQIAVLTRLGFGRLLAERGRPTPVVLDDALVYSDDIRIERLFGVLRMAAEHHQVVVLTCRARLFENSGGNRLELTRWNPD